MASSRGEEGGILCAFMAWIEACWLDDGPLEPLALPVAVGANDSAGPVLWYTGAPDVLG